MKPALTLLVAVALGIIPPLHFHLGCDTSEQRNVAAHHPDVLARIVETVNAHKAGVVPGPSQLQ